MVELIQGPATLYHDRRYETDQLESALNEQLETLRQRYPRQSMKNLEGHFQDVLKLVQHVEGKKRGELQVILSRDCGVSGPALGMVLDALDAITQATSS